MSDIIENDREYAEKFACIFFGKLWVKYGSYEEYDRCVRSIMYSFKLIEEIDKSKNNNYWYKKDLLGR